MENISVEQIIKVKPPKYAVFAKLAMILVCLFSLSFIFISYLVILTAVLIILTVFVFRYFNAEYEYTLVERELTVDKIIAKSYRRRCGVYNIDKIEIMAPYGSDKLIQYDRRNCKTHNYSSNTGTDNSYVIYAPCNNEMVKIILEPNEKIKESFWKLAPSKVNL